MDSIEKRQELLARAGYNVVNLDPVDVAIDLLTDIPPRVFDSEVLAAESAAARQGARDPDIQGLAEAVYGPAQYLAMTRGRAAEFAMVASFGKERPVVVTPGMWRTFDRAIVMQGGKVENAPCAKPGTSDLDVAWLDERLRQGGVDFVVLEPANGQVAGFPLSIENARAVAQRCKEKGVGLIIDATRVLANFLALGQDPLRATQELLKEADVFYVSCAKEGLVPYGGLLATRTRELEKKTFMYSLLRGVMLEPVAARVAVATGLARLRDSGAEPVRARNRQLARLAGLLRAKQLPVVEPLGAHAVFMDVSAIVKDRGPLAGKAFEALLYRVGGIRGSLHHCDALGRSLLRLVLPLGRYDDAAVDALAEGVVAAFTNAAEMPTLKPSAQPALFEIFSRYDVA